MQNKFLNDTVLDHGFKYGTVSDPAACQAAENREAQISRVHQQHICVPKKQLTAYCQRLTSQALGQAGLAGDDDLGVGLL